MSKTLIAYFSVGGTTKAAAERLSALIGAETYRILPLVPYENPDLDWTDPKSRTTLEMKDSACRPQIIALPDDIESYDRIFLGFPIWWYTAPRIIESFLDAVNLDGKVIVPFATSGGSELGDTVDNLKKSCGGNVLSGLMLRKTVSDDEIKAWAAQAL